LKTIDRKLTFYKLRHRKVFRDENSIDEGSLVEVLSLDKDDEMIPVMYKDEYLTRMFWIYTDELTEKEEVMKSVPINEYRNFTRLTKKFINETKS
jgi:hypothetical protein